MLSGMTEDVVVTRQFEIDVDADGLWDLLCDGSTWGEWLGQHANIVVAPGSLGVVADDDDVLRHVQIERVDRAEGLRFTWWPQDRTDQRSVVELTVVQQPGGAVLRVTETLPAGSMRASAKAQLAWGVRAFTLCALVASVVLV
jgi:uncharacterized protein YndB with AHSA1/START domain